MVRSAARAAFQRTIAETIQIDGIGVHSGREVSLTLHPADANSGIIFLRTGLSHGRDVEIPATWRHVVATELCTVIGDPDLGTVGTVEHLMAAFRGLGIDNCLVEIDGPEVPVMDGSAREFCDAILQAGIETQSERRRSIKILKPIRVESGSAFAEFRPAETSRFEVDIDFPNTPIGRQAIACDLTPEIFRTEIARARTFGFVKDLERLLPLGLCRGSSLENSVAIKDDRVLNPEGLRFRDEFVRHKTLDAIGDLALAGAPIIGLYRSYRGGHRLNFQALSALFDDPSAWMWAEAPSRREPAMAEIGLRAAAFTEVN